MTAADRYTKAVLPVIAFALIAIAGHLWMGQLRPRDAHAQTAAPKYEMSVPKGWGKLVSFSNNNLLVEAPDGTYRRPAGSGLAIRHQVPANHRLPRWRPEANVGMQDLTPI
ncbi:MAG: hypothetical protein Q7W02_14150 [Candidatus Rokubacteria bacterium]|nr:hypothetical protein [Candidatus Rokubacteria bacterium]